MHHVKQVDQGSLGAGLRDNSFAAVRTRQEAGALFGVTKGLTSVLERALPDRSAIHKEMKRVLERALPENAERRNELSNELKCVLERSLQEKSTVHKEIADAFINDQKETALRVVELFATADHM